MNIGPGQQQAPYHSASLYVGDLNQDVTEALLFEIFNAVGPVVSIRVCRDSITRRSLGYAYVNFHNVSDAERALDTMNYTPIKGTPSRIMWSQRDPGLRKSGVGNVFVKNLHASIDNKALYDTFSLFGNILSCKVAQDSKGVSKGFGFVHYETQDAANAAIEKIDQKEIGGQKVTVAQFQQKRAVPAQWTNCFVKNMPSSWDIPKLGEVFSAFGEVTSVVVMQGRPGRPDESSADGAGEARNIGFVNFKSHASAVEAVGSLNGRLEGDKELYVSRAMKKEERLEENRRRFQMMKHERVIKYAGVNLYVRNLSDSVNDERLRAEFAPFGNITSFKVMLDRETRRSRNFGFVCFAAPEEANEALAKMNGKLIDGKPVYVALAQDGETRRKHLAQVFAQQRAGGPGPGFGGAPAMPMGGPRNMFGAAPMYFPGPMPPAFFQQQQMLMARNGPRGPMAGFQRGAYQLPPYGGVPSMPGMPGPGMAGAPPMMQQPQPSQGQQQRGGPGLRPGMPGQQGSGRSPRVPGGSPRGGQQLGGLPGQQPVPQQQARGPANVMMAQQPGMPGAGGQAAQAQRNFKYTPNARNQPGVGAPAVPMAPASMMPQQPAGGAMLMPGIGALNPAELAQATPEMQKNLIGERLYPMVHMIRPDLAGKITGMLLEMDNGELLHLLESPEDMNGKVQLAVQVLNDHAAAETTSG